MSQDGERLERLITERRGECCAADVDDRIEALDGLLQATPETLDADLRAMKVLGNDTRYRIVRLLATADEELCVCEITPLFDVSDSAVSHALSDLVDAGLLTRRKDGTWRYYQVTERGAALLAALDETREGAA